jgi:hypothetical protein
LGFAGRLLLPRTIGTTRLSTGFVLFSCEVKSYLL